MNRPRRPAPARSRCPVRATSSGVPAATTRPPPSPPSGPRSITQSAARIDVQVVLDDEQRCGRRRSAGRTTAGGAPRRQSAARSSARRRGRGPRPHAAPEQFGGQQQPLPLPARERVGPLAEAQVAEAEVDRERPSGAEIPRCRAKKPCRLRGWSCSSTSAIDRPSSRQASTSGRKRRPPHSSHGTHTSGRKSMLTRMRPAPSHVSQRPPFTFVEKCRFASPAARASGVVGEAVANRVEDPEDRGGRTGGAAAEHVAVGRDDAREAARAAVTLDAATAAVAACAVSAGRQHVEHQRGLAAARDAGEGDEAARRDVHVEAAQVVAPGVAHARRRDAGRAVRARARPERGRRVRSAQAAAGHRPGAERQRRRRAGRHDAAALVARRRARGRSRGRPRGSRPRRARRRRRCCRRREGRGAGRAAARCRAGAGRRSARRARR